MKVLLLILIGLSFGILSSAGVFTVLLAVGLVPRFAGSTHTANRILLYEEMVIWGTIIGGIFSVFRRELRIGALLKELFPRDTGVILNVENGMLCIIGVFSGMFVGCLALAIAEMLDSFPILARRFQVKKGVGIAVLCVAIAKTIGALLYFG